MSRPKQTQRVDDDRNGRGDRLKPDANGAVITPGAIVIALWIDTIVADAPSEEIAMMGTAVRVMRLPTALTACAAHKRRKSACAHRDCVTGNDPFTDC